MIEKYKDGVLIIFAASAEVTRTMKPVRRKCYICLAFLLKENMSQYHFELKTGTKKLRWICKGGCDKENRGGWRGGSKQKNNKI